MKQLFKTSIIHALASRTVSSVMESFLQPAVPVFMFHRFNCQETMVNGHDPDYLRRCLQYLHQRGYNFVSLDQVIHALQTNTTLPARSIAFTMDDGFLDQATVAAPVFIEHHCPVTIFLISGFLDGELWPWDDQIAFIIKQTENKNLSIELEGKSQQFELYDNSHRRQTIHKLQNWIKTLDASQLTNYLENISQAASVAIPEQPPVNYQPMTWDHARSLEKKGVSFAPHTTSHRILSRQGNADAHHEITYSWQRLQQELRSPSPVFCYPTGRSQDFGNREFETIKQTGLSGAVSTEVTHVTFSNPDPNYLFRLPRFGFPDDFSDFIQYSGWIERAKTQILRR